MNAPSGPLRALRTNPSFAEATERVNAYASFKIPPTWLQEVLDYVNSPANKFLIEQWHRNRGNRSYSVFDKSVTGLHFRIKYYGPDDAYAKVHKDFTRGAFCFCSIYVHLHRKVAYAVKKIPIGDLSKVNQYYKLKHKHSGKLFGELMSESDIVEEKELQDKIFKDIPEVLKSDRVEKYTKKFVSLMHDFEMEIEKYAVYSELQTGEICSIPPQLRDECSRATIVALAKIEALGYLTNDISNRNILYSLSNGVQIRIIDLQFATKEESTQRYYAGSLFYCPPEMQKVLESGLKPMPKPPSDQALKHNRAKSAWQTAVSLFELYSYELSILDDSTPLKILSTRLPFIINLRSTCPQFMPQDIYSLLKRMTEMDPLKRLSLTEATAEIKNIKTP